MIPPMLGGEGFVWGGMFLIIFGALIAAFRRLPAQLWSLVERHLCFSLHVNDDDESFFWVKLWLGQKLSSSLSVSAYTRRQEAVPEYVADGGGDLIDRYKYLDNQSGHEVRDKRPVPVFVPAPGTYFFRHAGKYCWVTFERKEGDGAQALQKPRESFVLRAFTRDRSLGDKILLEARDVALPLDGKVEVRMGGNYNWQLVTRIPPRPIDSIVLHEDIARRVLEDVKVFIRSKDWYAKLGVPYRRGILLYGPPGNGKSSLVLGVASELGMNVNILSLSSPGMTDTKLIDLLGQCDTNTIVLIEDIDCAFQKRAKGKDKIDNLTFSGLLNAIDGVAAQGGRIIFMTTNHPKKLDPALIRDGRADLRIFIDNATQAQAARLFARFFPGEDALAAEFGAGVPDKDLPMAAIQGHLMKYRASPKEAVLAIPALIEEQAKLRFDEPTEQAA